MSGSRLEAMTALFEMSEHAGTLDGADGAIQRTSTGPLEGPPATFDLGDPLKIGFRSNFTDFSEDLTDLSYDHHGVFFNIVGTF